MAEGEGTGERTGAEATPDPLAGELRQRVRVAADLPVTLHLADDPAPVGGRCRDVGVSGLCVATRSDVEPEEVRGVTLQLGGAPFRLAARACWQSDVARRGHLLTGLSFEEVPAPALAALERLVAECARGIASFLSSSPDLRGLELEEVVWLAHVTRYREVPLGETVQGADAPSPDAPSPGGGEDDALLVLASGEASLELAAAAGRKLGVVDVGTGAVLGGLGLLGVGRPPCALVAGSALRLLEIDAEAYAHLEVTRPVLARKLAVAALRAHGRRLHALLAVLRGRG